MSQPFDAVIVGAGAAGLTAGYTLIHHYGWHVRIVEASDRFGGRLRKLNNFTDFPLDLGGGWLHVDSSVLDEIVNDPNVVIDKSNILDYDPDPYYYYDGDVWNQDSWPKKWTDHVWVNASWLDFFQKYIAPADSIEVDCLVESIDTRNESYIETNCSDGRSFRSGRVLVTVSMGILKRGDIQFLPALPDDKQRAIETIGFDPGLKAFFKFSENFYKYEAFDFYLNEGQFELDGERFFFDVTYGQQTTENILGVFMVGAFAKDPVKLDEDGLKDYILGLLDSAFNNQATEYYVSHALVNWSREPHVAGAYSNHEANQSYDMIGTMLRPVANNRIFFAGEALLEEYGYAHGAALSGREVAESMAASSAQGYSQLWWSPFLLGLFSMMLVFVH